jgi:hypothetical protein
LPADGDAAAVTKPQHDTRESPGKPGICVQFQDAFIRILRCAGRTTFRPQTETDDTAESCVLLG